MPPSRRFVKKVQNGLGSLGGEKMKNGNWELRVKREKIFIKMLTMGAEPSCQCPTPSNSESPTKCPSPANIERNSRCILQEGAVNGGSTGTVNGETLNTTYRVDGKDFIIEVDQMPSECRFNPGYTAIADEVTDTRLRLRTDDVCDYASINSSSLCLVETISIADKLRSGSGMILCNDPHKLGGFISTGEICRNRSDKSYSEK